MYMTIKSGGRYPAGPEDKCTMQSDKTFKTNRKSLDYLITMPPMRALLLFSIPMLIGNLFQQCYNMTDSIVVGRYVSENAMAAVGASYALTSVFIAVAYGSGVGAGVLTSSSFGAKKYRQMRMSISVALISFLILSILLGVFGYFTSDSILRLLKTPEECMADAVTYLKIYFLGLPFLFMYNILSALFNALGESKIPLYLLIFSSALNIVLDILFVISFQLGVAGVAWATLIAQGFSSVLSFVLFIRTLDKFPKGEPAPLFTWGIFRRMMALAIPSVLQQSAIFLGMLLVQSVVNPFGGAALAGYTAAMRVEGIVCVPFNAFNTAISSFTAQNRGAGKTDRVKSGFIAGWKLDIISSIIFLVILLAFTKQIIALFLGSNLTAGALKVGTDYIHFLAGFYFILGSKTMVDGVLRGLGHMKAFVIANFSNLAFRVITSAVLAPVLGIAFTWYPVPIGWTINFIISYFAGLRPWLKKHGLAGRHD